MDMSESSILVFMKDNLLIGFVLIVIFGAISYTIGKQAYTEFNQMKKQLDPKGI